MVHVLQGPEISSWRKTRRISNGKLQRYDGYCTDIFFDEAIGFIEEQRDKPFFTFIATNAPHTPLDVPEEWSRPYRDMGLEESSARLYGMVENIDYNLGRLMKQSQGGNAKYPHLKKILRTPDLPRSTVSLLERAAS